MIKIEQSSSEIYTSNSGVLLVGACLNNYANLESVCASLQDGGQISNSDMLRTYIGLLAQGKSDFEAAENVRENRTFKLSMGIKRAISSSRLRQRFDQDAIVLTENAIIPCNVNLLRNTKAQITGIYTGHVVMDFDTSPFNNSKTKKEDVSWTYKGFDGYNPMFGYLGKEGWCIASELHPGSWNGQKEFCYTIERAHTTARSLTALPLLWRLDSQHDALENMVQLFNLDDDFIIKWNKRKESDDNWLKIAKNMGHWCVWEQARPGKRIGLFTVYIEKNYRGKSYTFRRVMRVTEETISSNGQVLLVPEVEVEGWWTTLELPDSEIITLYEEHATSEQYHSEFKTDMDMERLPSGKFKTNDLVLNCGMLTYNILKYIGLTGLVGNDSPVRHPAKRRRVKTVMQELIYVAARLVEKGREVILRFSMDYIGFKAFKNVYERLIYDG
jgi:hypothetical protein